MIDSYLLLGLKPASTDEEVKSAYRKLVKIHHPDKGGSAERFKEITSAYMSITEKNIANSQSSQPYESKPKKEFHGYRLSEQIRHPKNNSPVYFYKNDKKRSYTNLGIFNSENKVLSNRFFIMFSYLLVGILPFIINSNFLDLSSIPDRIKSTIMSLLISVISVSLFYIVESRKKFDLIYKILYLVLIVLSIKNLEFGHIITALTYLSVLLSLFTNKNTPTWFARLNYLINRN